METKNVDCQKSCTEIFLFEYMYINKDLKEKCLEGVRSELQPCKTFLEDFQHCSLKRILG